MLEPAAGLDGTGFAAQAADKLGFFLFQFYIRPFHRVEIRHGVDAKHALAGDVRLARRVGRGTSEEPYAAVVALE